MRQAVIQTLKSIMTEQLFNALIAIETSASGMMKVYELPSGQGLDRWNDMARAAGVSLGSRKGFRRYICRTLKTFNANTMQ